MLERVGRFFFRLRSITPIPLILLMLYYAEPNWQSALSGATLVVIGELIRLWAVGYAGASTRTRSLGAARALVTTGPYAYVRNPLYLGNGLLSAGVCLASGVYWLLPLLGVGYVLQYVPIVRSEEAYLRRSCGEAYAIYYASVPRWLPRLKRYPRASNHDFSWGRALRSERRTLLAIAFTGFLLTAIAILKNA